MVIGNGFFSDTESDALREMKSRSGCEVKRCVFPTMGNLTYYLSIQGDLYGMQRVKGTGKYITRGPKTPDHGSHSKRRDGGITHRLKESPKHEKSIKAELLVYCTYILGRWEPDLRIDFKDGHATNIHPDNLEIHKEEIPHEWQERLFAYIDIYKSQFNEVVRRCAWWTDISREDAMDVVQSSYIYLCTDGYKKDPENFLGLWIHVSKLRSIDFIKNHTDHYNYEDYDLILELRGQRDKPVEVDLFHLQKGEKRQKFLTLWAQGHTPTEIAEMCGSTTTNVGSSVTHSIRWLQKYFRHEKELLTP